MLRIVHRVWFAFEREGFFEPLRGMVYLGRRVAHPTGMLLTFRDVVGLRADL